MRVVETECECFVVVNLKVMKRSQVEGRSVEEQQWSRIDSNKSL